MKKHKKMVIQLILLLCLLVGLTFLIEGVYHNWDALGNQKKAASVEITKKQRTYEKKGYIVEVSNAGHNLTIHFAEPTYVKNLFLEFSNLKYCKYQVTTTSVTDMDGEQIETVKDRRRYRLQTGITPLRKKVKTIEVSVDEGYKGRITKVTANNAFQFNKYRMVFIFSLLSMIAFFIFARKLFAQRLHWVFFFLSMVLSLNYWFPLGTLQVGWDENVHFPIAYMMAYGMEDVPVTQAVQDFMDYNYSTYTYNSADERLLLETKMAEDDIETISTVPSYHTDIRSITYLPYAIAIAVCRALKLPFAVMYMVVKLPAMLLYAGVMAYAVKKAKTAKFAIAALGLMPIRLFISAGYNYDGITMAFLTLGFVLWMNEVIADDKPIGIRSMLAIIVCFVIGSLAKLVYFPFLLLLAFMPNIKYQWKFKHADKVRKAAKIMLAIGIVAVIIVGAIKVQQYINLGSMVGDTRGNNEPDISKQLLVIVKNPVHYLVIMVQNIWDRFADFMIGSRGVMRFSRLKRPRYDYTYIGAALMLLVLLVQVKDDDTIVLKKKQKAGISLSLITAVAGMWTVMYVCFSAVGSETINGVQGRYYAPLYLPFIMLLRNKRWKIECNLKPQQYHLIMLAAIVLLNMFCIYEVIIERYCL